jgi:hypothetical protein
VAEGITIIADDINNEGVLDIDIHIQFTGAIGLFAGDFVM